MLAQNRDTKSQFVARGEYLQQQFLVSAVRNIGDVCLSFFISAINILDQVVHFYVICTTFVATIHHYC